MKGNYDQIFILTDEQAAKSCLLAFDKRSAPMSLSDIIAPAISALPKNETFSGTPINGTLVLPAGEEQKNLRSVQRIWDFLFAHGATRASLLVNIGGGVICDMGGFAAATYMRGIDFINIPTTLLAMVDAGAGGKTGIDYNGLKNAIGVFAEPKEVIIEPRFLATLPAEQQLSGSATVQDFIPISSAIQRQISAASSIFCSPLGVLFRAALRISATRSRRRD